MADSSERLKFSVDAALLVELGERLVGKSYIALAELVKNSYDADAAQVEIRFSEDAIEISDDGHGMSREEFVKFWMRVGSPHKRHERFSRHSKRPLTGSKGIGRLAVQFLARRIHIFTTSEADPKKTLSIRVNWDEAVQAGTLTEATASVVETDETVDYPFGRTHGTKIVLSELNQEWTPDSLRELAREVWWLRQPFHSNRDRADRRLDFDIDLATDDLESQEVFTNQLEAVMTLWTARINGELTSRKDANGNRLARVAVTFEDGESFKQEFPIPNCLVRKATYEIRIFNLKYRQPHGISVKEAREYFRNYGGVHIYDAGFHLPYYGSEFDWLGIEQDHAQREWTSKLLPADLNFTRGLNDLPTNARIFGIVNVDTSGEEEAAGSDERRKGKYLQIQLTRDRLVQNEAYENLVFFTRWSLDYYANLQRERQSRIESTGVEEISDFRFDEAQNLLEKLRDDIPAQAYSALRTGISAAKEAAQVENESVVRRANLMGALASVGMSTLAFQHELNNMYGELESIRRALENAPVVDGEARRYLAGVSDRLSGWVERSRATQSLFSHMLERDNRENRLEFNARSLVEQVYENLGVLRRGVPLDTTCVDSSLTLPRASYAEWTSVFQNVFLNAINAMLDTARSEKKLHVSTHERGGRQTLLVQDTGSGIDLAKAESYFQAFERDMRISDERRALGVGGTGLGLTIVRAIATNLNCTAAFVEPEAGFRTAFQLEWRSK